MDEITLHAFIDEIPIKVYKDDAISYLSLAYDVNETVYLELRKAMIEGKELEITIKEKQK